MHYRLVAGVIELPPEIEMIAQERQRVGWSTDQGRNYSLLSGYGIQLNPTCCRSIMLNLQDNRDFLYPLIDK
jgi:hypothetical protein